MYNYKGKYMLTGTFRADGSSKFQKNNKWGYFPFALLLGVDDAVLNAGLMGYNGVLCAIALGDKTWKGGAWATVAVLLSVLLQIGGMKWGITTLTAPFVVAVWIVAGCRAGWKNRNRN